MDNLKGLKIIPAVWKKVVSLFAKHPVILVPFLLAAVVDLVLLFVLFLAPRPPLSTVIAPIIKAFWGERFLHYPVNFLLLPHLFNYVRNISSFITGVFFSGIAIAMIAHAFSNEKPEWWFGIKKAGKRYLRLVFVWGITFACILAAAKLSGYAGRFLYSFKMIFGFEFLVTAIVQMIFVIAIPAVIIENKKTFIAITRSLAILKNYPVAVFVIVILPSLLFIPVTYIHLKMSFLIERTSPDIVLYILILRLALITVIDILITSSAAVLLLMHKEKENGRNSV